MKGKNTPANTPAATASARSVTVAFFDAKPYDREYFEAALAGESSANKSPARKFLARKFAARKSGAAVDIHFHDTRLNAETAALARGAAAVCVFVNDRLDAPCLAQLHAHGVRLVALRCAGFNNVDLAAAKELGIAVTRVPAYSPHAVAEHTLALLLTLNRKIHRAHNRVREQNFSLNGLVGADLHGKTAGVIGTGKIGRLVAGILRNGFGMTVLASDPFPDAKWARASRVTYVANDELFAASDVLTLHAPLTRETSHLVNERSLARMKPGVIIVNTGRGKLIDTHALIQALKTGRVGGVALDVYEEEEGIFFEDLSGTVLQDDELARLLTFPNVLITSHQAFLTSDALGEIARVTLENIRHCATATPYTPGTQVA